jgi:hypothetical protein
VLKGLIFGATGVAVTSPHASERKALVLRLTLLAPEIAILEGQQQKSDHHVQSETARVCDGARFERGMASVRGDEELAAAWLHRSFDPYFNGKKRKAN